jgi:hypothetical protein
MLLPFLVVLYLIGRIIHNKILISRMEKERRRLAQEEAKRWEGKVKLYEKVRRFKDEKSNM